MSVYTLPARWLGVDEDVLRARHQEHVEAARRDRDARYAAYRKAVAAGRTPTAGEQAAADRYAFDRKAAYAVQAWHRAGRPAWSRGGVFPTIAEDAVYQAIDAEAAAAVDAALAAGLEPTADQRRAHRRHAERIYLAEVRRPARSREAGRAP